MPALCEQRVGNVCFIHRPQTEGSICRFWIGISPLSFRQCAVISTIILRDDELARRNKGWTSACGVLDVCSDVTPRIDGLATMPKAWVEGLNIVGEHRQRWGRLDHSPALGPQGALWAPPLPVYDDLAFVSKGSHVGSRKFTRKRESIATQSGITNQVDRLSSIHDIHLSYRKGVYLQETRNGLQEPFIFSVNFLSERTNRMSVRLSDIARSRAPFLLVERRGVNKERN